MTRSVEASPPRSLFTSRFSIAARVVTAVVWGGDRGRERQMVYENRNLGHYEFWPMIADCENQFVTDETQHAPPPLFCRKILRRRSSAKSTRRPSQGLAGRGGVSAANNSQRRRPNCSPFCIRVRPKLARPAHGSVHKPNNIVLPCEPSCLNSHNQKASHPACPIGPKAPPPCQPPIPTGGRKRALRTPGSMTAGRIAIAREAAPALRETRGSPPAFAPLNGRRTEPKGAARSLESLDSGAEKARTDEDDGGGRQLPPPSRPEKSLQSLERARFGLSEGNRRSYAGYRPQGRWGRLAVPSTLWGRFERSGWRYGQPPPEAAGGIATKQGRCYPTRGFKAGCALGLATGP